MLYNSDFKHDLEVGQVRERQLGELLESQTIEVKTDFRAYETGNVYVEYRSRYKPSGLATTQADWYCFYLSENHLLIIRTQRLKQLCRPYYGTKRDVFGGDSNTSKGILLPLDELIRG